MSFFKRTADEKKAANLFGQFLGEVKKKRPIPKIKKSVARKAVKAGRAFRKRR